MFRRLASWRGRSGAYTNTGICCVRTLLVYLTLDGYHKFWFKDPGILEHVERTSGCGTPPKTFCRWKGLGHWKTAAMNTQGWYEYTSRFCSFIFEAWNGPCLIPTVHTRVPWMGYTRANAPLVFRFHSLTRTVTLEKYGCKRSTLDDGSGRDRFFKHAWWPTSFQTCMVANFAFWFHGKTSRIKTSFATLTSRNGGKSCPTSNPNEHPSTHVCHIDIAQWSTEANKARIFVLRLP